MSRASLLPVVLLAFVVDISTYRPQRISHDFEFCRRQVQTVKCRNKKLLASVGPEATLSVRDKLLEKCACKMILFELYREFVY